MRRMTVTFANNETFSPNLRHRFEKTPRLAILTFQAIDARLRVLISIMPALIVDKIERPWQSMVAKRKLFSKEKSGAEPRFFF